MDKSVTGKRENQAIAGLDARVLIKHGITFIPLRSDRSAGFQLRSRFVNLNYNTLNVTETSIPANLQVERLRSRSSLDSSRRQAKGDCVRAASTDEMLVDKHRRDLQATKQTPGTRPRLSCITKIHVPFIVRDR